jgi:O-antigen ligase
MTSANRIRALAEAGGRNAAAFLGFSIPISIALDNLLLVLVAALWLAGGGLRDKLDVVRSHPFALAAVALFALLAAGTAYGVRDPGDGWGYLKKYLDLLFVPLFIAFFRDARARRNGILCFCAAVLLSIAFAWLVRADLLLGHPVWHRGSETPASFKFSITQGLMAALAAYLFALLAREQPRGAMRLAYAALALAAAHHVVFTMVSRTAYLVLLALFVCFCATSFGRRGFAAALVASALFAGAAYVASPGVQQRVQAAVDEVRHWQPGRAASRSVDLRLEFYRTGAGLIAERPLFGSGTGSFPRVYAGAVAGSGKTATTNPHNEYILIGVQLGLVGLAAFGWLMVAHWRAAAQLAGRFERDLARGLLLWLAIGSLFNSMLLDHTEGLLFAWLSALVLAAPRKMN